MELLLLELAGKLHLWSLKHMAKQDMNREDTNIYTDIDPTPKLRTTEERLIPREVVSPPPR